MKVNIAVDCTPDEARRFLGLPEVAPMQQHVIEAMEKRLVEAISTTDTATLVEQWMPLTLKGIEQWQSLWGQLTQTAASVPPGSGGTAQGKPDPAGKRPPG